MGWIIPSEHLNIFYFAEMSRFQPGPIRFKSPFLTPGNGTARESAPEDYPELPEPPYVPIYTHDRTTTNCKENTSTSANNKKTRNVPAKKSKLTPRTQIEPRKMPPLMKSKNQLPAIKNLIDQSRLTKQKLELFPRKQKPHKSFSGHSSPNPEDTGNSSHVSGGVLIGAGSGSSAGVAVTACAGGLLGERQNIGGENMF